MKPAAKQIEIEKNYQDRKVNIEMKRLREKCSIENLYTFLNDNTLNNINNDDKLAIMFHNIRAFNNDKKNHIQYDHGFRKADVIMLVETHTQLKHTRHVQLNDYKVLFTSGSNQKYSSHGQICFVKNDKINFFTLLAHNANQQTYESKNMLEMSLFEYMCPTGKDIFYICLLYKHPQMKNSEFAHELEEFISKHFRIINNNKIDKGKKIARDK